MKNLVIVESPSKSKTIEKYLGSDYHVVSSKGHIRDLATTGKGGLGIDVENGFIPNYKISSDKKEVVKDLQKLAKKSDHVYLASDPDREGEAIAWHLATVLGLDMNEDNRIVFHEITKQAILEVKHPQKIDQDLVKSQETRRMLDRIIGFRLSKLLQNKIQSKSAGRVQSVALRLIVERENEIRKFKKEEYWTLDALCHKGKSRFTAGLQKVDGKKAKLKNKEETDAIITRCAQGPFVVSNIERKVKKKEPKMPFITSTLQQEASNKLGFGAKKTMQIAQKLYEGIDLGGRSEGLITYMRSDSTRLSPVFLNDAFHYIETIYGKEYRGRARQKNDENAQDAHEAIRMTNVMNTPESVKQYLTNDQYKLYHLIYSRTMASLMAPAKSDAVSVQIDSCGCQFTASGSTLTFDGYLKVYGKYEQVKDDVLPPLEAGETLEKVKLEGKQHFTEPPLRYSEARLIKELEEKGIGRPSTYAMIILSQFIKAFGMSADAGALIDLSSFVFFLSFITYPLGIQAVHPQMQLNGSESCHGKNTQVEPMPPAESVAEGKGKMLTGCKGIRNSQFRGKIPVIDFRLEQKPETMPLVHRIGKRQVETRGQHPHISSRIGTGKTRRIPNRTDQILGPITLLFVQIPRVDSLVPEGFIRFVRLELLCRRVAPYQETQIQDGHGKIPIFLEIITQPHIQSRPHVPKGIKTYFP